MYLDFFEFREMPFHITPNPSFLFLSPTHYEALQHLRYGIEERKGFIVITGEVGCGKTTLLHLIGGLMPPKEGVLEVAGEILSEKPKAKLDRFRGEHIGIVFQKPHLVRSLTVKENLILSQYLAHKKTDGKRADEVLERLGIKELSEKPVPPPC